MADTYVSPTELLNSGEDVQEIIAESKDFVPYELLEPTHGDNRYISKSRELAFTKKVSKKGQPFISVKITVSELEDQAGNTIKLQYPVDTYINTLQFGKNNFGTSSSVASYLLEAGFAPKELSGEAMLEALSASAVVPLEAVVGWTDKGVKNEAGEWTNLDLVTKDFNIGTKEEPHYVPTVDRDGVTVKAKHRIVAFRGL